MHTQKWHRVCYTIIKSSCCPKDIKTHFWKKKEDHLHMCYLFLFFFGCCKSLTMISVEELGFRPSQTLCLCLKLRQLSSRNSCSSTWWSSATSEIKGLYDGLYWTLYFSQRAFCFLFNYNRKLQIMNGLKAPSPATLLKSKRWLLSSLETRQSGQPVCSSTSGWSTVASVGIIKVI